MRCTFRPVAARRRRGAAAPPSAPAAAAGVRGRRVDRDDRRVLGAASVTPAALRGRVLRELVLAGALPRTTRWPPVLAGWLMAAGLLAWKAGDVRDAAGAVTVLRVVAVLLATSVVALADDAAENQLAAAPVPLAWRYGVRCGVAALAVAIPWAGALLWVRPGDLAAALSLGVRGADRGRARRRRWRRPLVRRPRCQRGRGTRGVRRRGPRLRAAQRLGLVRDAGGRLGSRAPAVGLRTGRGARAARPN